VSTGDARLDDPVASPEDRRLVHAECVRIARRLRAEGVARVGLLPADAEIAAPPFAIELAAALSQLCGGDIAVVDANLRWPAFPRPARRHGGDGPPSSAPADRAGAFSARRARDGVTVLTPRARASAAVGLELARGVVDEWSSRCAHLVVDLTGFDAIGNLLDAVSLADGVLLLAAAGTTRTADLARLHAELPEAARLGVVLLG
jgi:hypothetical protein